MKFRIQKLIGGDETSGQVSVFKEITTAGSGPPLHLHTHQIEVFHVIKGRHAFVLGDKRLIGEEGECILIPAGVPHTFKNIDEGEGIVHFELLPSNQSEDFFEKLVSSFDQIEDLPDFFLSHGLELIGPPMD